MLRLIGGKTAPAVLVPILAACFVSSLAASATAAGLLVEPGVPLGDGSWLLPVGLVAEDGTVAPPGVGALIVLGPEQEPLGYVPVPLAPAANGLPSGRVVLLDGPLPVTTAASRWQEVLVASMAERGRDAPRRVIGASAAPHYDWDAGTREPVAEVAAALGLPDAARLWDSVLEALRLLASRDDLVRRVLVVVSDGEEELVSETVLASCVEAAARARIAVHVLVSDPERAGAAGVARLRALAARTGGFLRVAGADGPRDLEHLLTACGGVTGLRIEPPLGAALPARLELRLVADPAVRAEGEVAARRPLASPGPWRWLVPAAGLVAVAAAGWWLWRRQRRTLGVLMVRTRGGMRRFPVPRSGVSLGTDPDNSLVLPSERLDRHHAVISLRHGALHVTDLRSVGGTRVNGRPTRTQRLADGDRILLSGTVELVYRENDS